MPVEHVSAPKRPVTLAELFARPLPTRPAVDGAPSGTAQAASTGGSVQGICGRNASGKGDQQQPARDTGQAGVSNAAASALPRQQVAADGGVCGMALPAVQVKQVRSKLLTQQRWVFAADLQLQLRLASCFIQEEVARVSRNRGEPAHCLVAVLPSLERADKVRTSCIALQDADRTGHEVAQRPANHQQASAPVSARPAVSTPVPPLATAEELAMASKAAELAQSVATPVQAAVVAAPQTAAAFDASSCAAHTSQPVSAAAAAGAGNAAATDGDGDTPEPSPMAAQGSDAGPQQLQSSVLGQAAAHSVSPAQPRPASPRPMAASGALQPAASRSPKALSGPVVLSKAHRMPGDAEAAVPEAAGASAVSAATRPQLRTVERMTVGKSKYSITVKAKVACRLFADVRGEPSGDAVIVAPDGTEFPVKLACSKVCGALALLWCQSQMRSARAYAREAPAEEMRINGLMARSELWFWRRAVMLRRLISVARCMAYAKPSFVSACRVVCGSVRVGTSCATRSS